MGTTIYNPADIEEIQKWRDLANTDIGQTIESLETVEMGTLALAEAVATVYEDNLARQDQVDEVLATIYEAVLDGGVK